VKLTSTSVRTLALEPDQRERIFFCDDLPGFGVRVRAGGSRNFVCQYKFGGKHRRLNLGAVGAIDLSKARATAKDLLAAVRLGRDPAGERAEAQQAAAETFGAILPRFLVRQRSEVRPRSYLANEHNLLIGAKSLHPRPLKSIDRRTIAELLSALTDSGGPHAANRVRSTLSSYFSWLIREGLLETNPVTNTNLNETRARERVLTDVELRAIWVAAGDDRYGSIIKILMLTSARRDEIGSLLWSEACLDAALIRLPAERTKNGRPQDIPLTAPALAILRAQPRNHPEFVFGGVGHGGFTAWSKSKTKLDVRLSVPIPDWRLHDFRRTVSTVMHDQLGIYPHIVESVLAHVGHKAGVAGVYNKAKYAHDKRNALTRWAEYLMGIVEERENKIIPLQPKNA
jgi:integrase